MFLNDLLGYVYVIRDDDRFNFLLKTKGPVVGEFPCQNDVNLAPAPPLPQVKS